MPLVVMIFFIKVLECTKDCHPNNNLVLLKLLMILLWNLILEAPKYHEWDELCWDLPCDLNGKPKLVVNYWSLESKYCHKLGDFETMVDTCFIRLYSEFGNELSSLTSRLIYKLVAINIADFVFYFSELS